MNSLYKKNSAMYARLSTDAFWIDPDRRVRWTGDLNEVAGFIEDFGLKDETLWHRFVEQFRTHADGADGAWRGEYWGKMMRGACFVYAYTRSDALYAALEKTVTELMESAEEDGRISSYEREKELTGWDVWCRKYVLLGMQYFLEICKDAALCERIRDSMRAQADALIATVGDEEGKRPITKTSDYWRGLNACSVLEPIVRLYSITGEDKYLDFASYIVSTGGTSVVNLIDLAFEDGLMPYQYPLTKAYEMISFFEGVLEYYRVTGKTEYRTAVERFALRLLETDFTVIGCSGCTHELFDHSAVRQANTQNGETMQETCVTVTLMKFFSQMNLLTGDARYADALERSFYNAYLGAVNTERRIEPFMYEEHPDWHLEPLPFSSYSPLVAGVRSSRIGGLLRMSDNHYYGCCACIGAAGIGLVPQMHLLRAKDGFALNFYIPGCVEGKSPEEQSVTLETQTAYPRKGEVVIRLSLAREERFSLYLRIPAWSKRTELAACGEHVTADVGYVCVDRLWKNGDLIRIAFDMRIRVIRPIPYGKDILMNDVIWSENYVVPRLDREDPLAKHHLALERGPLVLAQDNRLGYSVDTPVDIAVRDGYVDALLLPEDATPYPHMVALSLPLSDGSRMTVTDYASAGKSWTEESKMAAWMLTV